jgi:hypothetical protein
VNHFFYDIKRSVNRECCYTRQLTHSSVPVVVFPCLLTFTQGFANYPEASTYSLVICHDDTHIARYFRATIEALRSNQHQLAQHLYDD